MLNIKKIIHFLRELQQENIKVVDANYLLELENNIDQLRKDNAKMMETFYSANASRSIMEEIREIIDCPVGNDIVSAIRSLKNGE